MSLDHVDKLKQLKAEYEADEAEVKTELVQIEQQQHELERKREELRQLIEGVEGVLSSIRGNNAHLQHVVKVAPLNGSSSESSQSDALAANESPKNHSRRQLVLRIIPEFNGETFTASDVREKFVERYLGGVEPPNFPQAINNLLKRMVDNDEIEQVGRKGHGLTDPWLYRAKNREETFNLGP